MPQSHLRYSVRGVDRKEPARDIKSEEYQLQQSQYQLSFVPPDYVSTTGGIQLDSKTISHANRFVSGSVPQCGWAISYDESSDIFRGSVQLPVYNTGYFKGPFWVPRDPRPGTPRALVLANIKLN